MSETDLKETPAPAAPAPAAPAPAAPAPATPAPAPPKKSKPEHTEPVDLNKRPLILFNRVGLYPDGKDIKTPFLEPICLKMNLKTLVPIDEPVTFRASWIDDNNDKLLLSRFQTEMKTPGKYMIPMSINVPKAENLTIESLFSLSILKVEAFLLRTGGNKPIWDAVIFVNVEDPSGKYKRPTDADIDGEDLNSEEEEEYEEEEEDEEDLGSFIVDEEDDGEKKQSKMVSKKDGDEEKEEEEEEADEQEEANEEEKGSQSDEGKEKDQDKEQEIVMDTEFLSKNDERPTEELLATFFKTITTSIEKIKKEGILED